MNKDLSNVHLTNRSQSQFSQNTNTIADKIQNVNRQNSMLAPSEMNVGNPDVVSDTRSQVSNMPSQMPGGSKNMNSSLKAPKQKAAAAATGQKNPALNSEVFSWGGDLHGQLGLGLVGASKNNMQPMPKFCTYGISIREVACGESHSAFVTTDNYLYTIGNNEMGQLGISDQNIKSKNSPVLVESLISISVGIQSVSCGHRHTVACSQTGEVYTWGEGAFGALGIPAVDSDQFAPLQVNLGDVSIVQASAGGKHTLLLDTQGRVFSCGNNEDGQLGLISRGIEQTPALIPNFNDMVQMVAAGSSHSLILTRSGLVYAFGSNSENQLGIPAKRSSTTPICVQDISHIPMCYIAAGGFSASISSDNKSLYIWGTSTFGELEIPNRVKKIPEKVQQVSIGEEFGVALTEDQKIYTWGENTNGQLGKGDFQSVGSPKQINKLTADGKVISKVACGGDFVLCLGQVEAVADQMQQQNIYERKVSNVESAVMKQQKANQRKMKSMNRDNSSNSIVSQNSQVLSQGSKSVVSKQTKVINPFKTKASFDKTNNILSLRNVQEVEMLSALPGKTNSFGDEVAAATAAQVAAAPNSSRGGIMKKPVRAPSRPKMVVKQQRSLSGDSDEYAKLVQQPATMKSSRKQQQRSDSVSSKVSKSSKAGTGAKSKKSSRQAVVKPPPATLKVDYIDEEPQLIESQNQEKSKQPSIAISEKSKAASQVSQKVAAHQDVPFKTTPIPKKSARKASKNSNTITSSRNNIVSEIKSSRQSAYIDNMGPSLSSRTSQQNILKLQKVKSESSTTKNSQLKQKSIDLPVQSSHGLPKSLEQQIADLQDQVQMLAMEKREAEDEAYREHQKAKHLEEENDCLRSQKNQMEGQAQHLSNTLTRNQVNDDQVRTLQDQLRQAHNDKNDLQNQLSLQMAQVRDREAELQRKQNELLAKSDCLQNIDDDIKIMQSHIDQLDKNNELYMQENAKLRREIENLKQLEVQIRSQKSQLDHEKEMRVSSEFDIAKLRHEVADLIAQKTSESNKHERAMNDLRYQNEDNIKNLNLKIDEIEQNEKQNEALNMVIESRDNTIIDLKESVIQSEIKARRLLEQLNKSLHGSAQDNIDKQLDALAKKSENQDPGRLQRQRDQGVVANSDARLGSLMNVDRPKLTPEIALQELTNKMKNEQELTGGGAHHKSNFSFDGQNQGSASLRPAQLLQQSLDHTNWKTPGDSTMKFGRSRGTDHDDAGEIGEKALADSQMTSTMIKQSLADLRSRLNNMKKDGHVTQMY